jgi:chromosome segregation ATPase
MDKLDEFSEIEEIPDYGELQSSLDRIINESNSLKKYNEELQADYDRIQGEYEDLYIKNDKREVEISKLDYRIKELREEHDLNVQYLIDIKLLRKNIKDSKFKNMVIEDQLDNLSIELKYAKNDLNECDKLHNIRISEKEAEINFIRSKFIDIENERINLQSEKIMIENVLETNQNSLINKLDLIHKLEVKIRNDSETISDLKEALEYSKAENNKVIEGFNDYKQYVIDNEKNKVELTAEFTEKSSEQYYEYQNKIMTMEKEHNKKIQVMKLELAWFELESFELNKKHNIYLKSNEDLNYQVSTLTECNNDLNYQVSTLTECNNDLNDQVSTLTECNNDLNYQASNLTECNNDLTGQFSTLSECNNDLVLSFNKLKESYDIIENGLDYYTTNYTSLYNQYNSDINYYKFKLDEALCETEQLSPKSQLTDNQTNTINQGTHTRFSEDSDSDENNSPICNKEYNKIPDSSSSDSDSESDSSDSDSSDSDSSSSDSDSSSSDSDSSSSDSDSSDSDSDSTDSDSSDSESDSNDSVIDLTKNSSLKNMDNNPPLLGMYFDKKITKFSNKIHDKDNDSYQIKLITGLNKCIN